jgi:tetratricopeptide (TPR) repeat protein
LSVQDLSRNDLGRQLVTHTTQQRLQSLGRKGLSELLRLSVVLLTSEYRDDPSSLTFETAAEGVKILFEKILPSMTQHGDRKAGDPSAEPLGKLYEDWDSPLAPFLSETNLRPGNQLFWHQCILYTPSSTAQYEGPHLVNNRYLSAAYALIDRGDLTAAKEQLRRGIGKVVPGQAKELWTLLIRIYIREGDFDGGLEMCNLAVTQNPEGYRNEKLMWCLYYDAYIGKKDYCGAIDRFSLAIEKNEGEYCWVLRNMVYLMYLDDIQKARELLENASNILPSFAAHCWDQIGVGYKDLRKPDQAIKAFETSTSLAPDHLWYWQHLIELYETCGKSEDAGVALQRAIGSTAKCSLELKSTRIWLLEKFLKQCLDKGQIDLAIEELEKELIHTPEDREARKLLAQAYSASGDNEKAIGTLRDAIENGWYRPGEVTQVLESLGEQYRSMGKLTEAIQVYEEALRRDPEAELVAESLKDAYSEKFGQATAEELFICIQRKGYTLDILKKGHYELMK